MSPSTTEPLVKMIVARAPGRSVLSSARTGCKPHFNASANRAVAAT